MTSASVMLIQTLREEMHTAVEVTHGPMILEDIDVFATLMMLSLPSSSTFTVRCSWMYLQASLCVCVCDVCVRVCVCACV